MVTCRVEKCLYHDSNYNIRYVGDILGHYSNKREKIGNVLPMNASIPTGFFYIFNVSFVFQKSH